MSFSADHKFYNLHCEGPNIPYNVLKSADGVVSKYIPMFTTSLTKEVMFSVVFVCLSVSNISKL